MAFQNHQSLPAVAGLGWAWLGFLPCGSLPLPEAQPTPSQWQRVRLQAELFSCQVASLVANSQQPLHYNYYLMPFRSIIVITT